MKTLLLLCLLIFLFHILLRIFETRSVFLPAKYPNGFWKPETYGLNPEDCHFSAADGTKLHGWFLKAENPKATILWSHGNAGNITHRLDNFSKLAALPFNIFLYDYRGYGKSKGRPNEHGVYLDALAAYDYLLTRPEVEPGKMVLYGRSLGGAIALDLALKRPALCLILEATFTSAEDMAKLVFGPVPVGWLQRMKFPSIEKIASLRVPLLMLHGDQDDVVPYKYGKRLFNAAPEPKEFYKIAQADHNNTYTVGGPKYFEKIENFILSNL